VAGSEPVSVPVEFVLFGLTLLGVALFHHHTLRVALAGLGAIVAYKLLFTGFKTGPGLAGLASHVQHEWVILTNLFGLLVGFAILSRHFEDSHVSDVLPRFLPDDWRGGFALLAVVFVLSGLLDNIAGALIGGAIAHAVFRGRVHVGFLAAIVAASNAGGAGSVVGDTTTTMMWIAGASPLAVLPAYVGAIAALLVFGVPAAIQQRRHQPIQRDPTAMVTIDWIRVAVVAFILLAAIAVNVTVNVWLPESADSFPFFGVAVWVAIALTAALRRPAWTIVPEAARGSLFLLALVLCASLMPVERLPAAAWTTALALGFLSAVFDNIPLTALALKQGGYDWGVLAYSVGFGGSMIWFGSSAGVALSNLYPEARSARDWLRHGWHVAPAYVVGFFTLLLLVGWNPKPLG
jgi:Na+/H+ antiporter NhaD/arsenite permease-like protein